MRYTTKVESEKAMLPSKGCSNIFMALKFTWLEDELHRILNELDALFNGDTPDLTMINETEVPTADGASTAA